MTRNLENIDFILVKKIALHYILMTLHQKVIYYSALYSTHAILCNIEWNAFSHNH